MPLSRLVQVFIFTFFFVGPLWAQRTTPPPGSQIAELPAPKRDAQAISVLNQAIAVAGGMEKLAAVRDYRANGTITRHETDREVQGLVTISGSGVASLKVEENLSTGNRLELADAGRIAANDERGTSRGVTAAPFLPGNHALPFRQLVTLLKDTNLEVTYKGLVQVDGKSFHQIHAGRLFPPFLDSKGQTAGQLSKDFFIDAATFQVTLIRDMIAAPRVPYRASGPGTPRQTRYSDYRQVNGMLVPYSLEEEVGGKPLRSIRLDSITINPGLRKEDFKLGTSNPARNGR